MWYVYIIRCEDSSLYTGVTTDVQRRFKEHKDGTLGAKYTKSKKAKSLVYKRAFKTRSNAQKEETRIKSLKKKEKEALVAEFMSKYDTISK